MYECILKHHHLQFRFEVKMWKRGSLVGVSDTEKGAGVYTVGPADEGGPSDDPDEWTVEKELQ